MAYLHPGGIWYRMPDDGHPHLLGNSSYSPALLGNLFSSHILGGEREIFRKMFHFYWSLADGLRSPWKPILHRLEGEKFNKWSNIIPGARSSPALPNDTYLFLVPESTPPGQNTRNNITFHWLHKFKFMIMVNSVLPAARTHLPLLSKFRPLLRKTRVVGPARSSIICVLWGPAHKIP